MACRAYPNLIDDVDCKLLINSSSDALAYFSQHPGQHHYYNTHFHRLQASMIDLLNFPIAIEE
jgi:hypothetical protein